jgi:hypothetical protein
VHAADPHPDWRIWIEPRFMRAPVSAPIPNAQRTEFAAGRRADEALTPLPKGELEKLGVDWKGFAMIASENCADDLGDLQAKMVRGKHRVIEYVELQSEHGLMASAVLAPQFLESFTEILGPSVLLIIPTRYTAYVFPRLVSNYEDYAGMALEEYRNSTFPVSLEVFELSKDGLHAFGTFADPGP